MVFIPLLFTRFSANPCLVFRGACVPRRLCVARHAFLVNSSHNKKFGLETRGPVLHPFYVHRKNSFRFE